VEKDRERRREGGKGEEGRRKNIYRCWGTALLDVPRVV